VSVVVDPLSTYALAFITFATGITIDLNVAAAATILAALIAAYPSAKLIKANRKKVIEEAGDVADRRVERVAKLWEADNKVLRARLSHVEGKLEATEHRCDVLERLLMEHGIPIPRHK
jgi:hypothetical protein